MALVLADRVRETTTTTGTGTVTLAGAVTGYQSFSVVGNGNTTYYCIAGQSTSEWEVGIGTYTLSGTTLARTTVLASSNSGSLVNFSAGIKDVFVTYPSEKSVNLDGSGLLSAPAGLGTGVPAALNVSVGSAGAFVVNGGALGTPSSGTVTNLTGTASININGTVGATTPAAGTFTTLSSTGNTTIGDASADTVTINGTVQPGMIISGSSSGDALRITQTGAGNALVVEDSSNPDSTPFVIDASGRIIDGYTSALTNYSAGGGNRTPQVQIQGLSTSFATQSITNWASGTTATGASYLILSKSTSAEVGTQGALNGADQYIGVLQFNGDDGTNFIPSAWIRSATDGTPGANDMPGRLEFATTAAGASSPTERMRINSSGNVGIGTATPGTLVDITASNSGLTSTTANNTLRFTDSDTTTAANQPIGVIEFYSSDSSAGGTGVSAYILSQAAGTSGGGNLVFGTAPSAGSGSPVERLRIVSGDGTLTSQPTYDNTNGGAVNMVVTSTGQIRRSTSSIKYKKDVEDLSYPLVSNAIDNLRPVWYRSKNASGDDKETWSHIGLIAEEVHEVEPRLVSYRTATVEQVEVPVLDADGNPILREDGTPEIRIERVETQLETPEPEGVDYARLSVLLLVEVKLMRAEIQQLKAKVAALEGAQ